MYKEVADKITAFLFSRQVILKNIKIELDNKGLGNFEGKILRGDKKKSKFTFCVKKEKLYVQQKGKLIGPLEKFFRLEFGDFNYNIDINENKVVETLKGFNKLNFLIKRLYFQSQRSFSHAIKGDFSLLQDLIKRIKKRFIKEIQLKNKGGTTFKIKKISNKFVELECYDHGGIFDENVSNEGDTFPPQVMGEYEADAYAAYCFARKYLETKKTEYLESSLMCLDFIKRTYNYYPAGIFGIAHDFKNPAYTETLLLLGKKTENYNDLIKHMREDLYEATNVFALRYYWHSIRKKFINDNYLKIPLKRLKRDQTPDGLIKDDNDNDYKNAHDLTYHCYTLASLARGLEFNFNPEIKKIFLEGIEFSFNVLTKNGEVSYNGRAANNIYHLASCIYAFEFATKYLKNKDELRNACELMFNYLKQWQKADGSFPTAMNNYWEKRISWSHCSTPYNAFVAYALYLSEDLHEKYNKKEFPNKFLIKDRYAIFSNKNYYFTFFSGCTRSYGWSGEMHRTGIPGMSILGKKESLIPCLDETQNIIVSDISTLFFNKKILSFYNKAKLIKKNNSFIYIKKFRELIFEREYILKDKEIKVKTKIKFLKKGYLKGYLIRIPLFSNKYQITKNFVKYQNLKYIVNTENSIITKELTNPRGLVRVLCCNEFNDKVKKNEILEYDYKILIE